MHHRHEKLQHRGGAGYETFLTTDPNSFAIKRLLKLGSLTLVKSKCFDLGAAELAK